MTQEGDPHYQNVQWSKNVVLNFITVKYPLQQFSETILHQNNNAPVIQRSRVSATSSTYRISWKCAVFIYQNVYYFTGSKTCTSQSHLDSLHEWSEITTITTHRLRFTCFPMYRSSRKQKRACHQSSSDFNFANLLLWRV